MSRELCPFEPAVLRAVRFGLVDAELRAHTEGCADCEELLELAGLLDAERREAMAEAPIPPAGALWLQMRLRAAREAQVRSTNTTRLIEGVSLIAALAIALASFGLPELTALPRPPLEPWSIALLASAALFALVAPIAVWLGLERS
ncbi:MAG TPA: hypothetical protein VMS56_14525 [Thermoanaerobaculia bacterium]|nr:hypothetical protein [Thermoanaerobaculia bacterium]